MEEPKSTADFVRDMMKSRKEAIDTLLSVYTKLGRFSERLGNKMPSWCLTYTGMPIEEWYKQAVILPPSDCVAIRKQLKGPIDFYKYRDDRNRPYTAPRDISEVDEHIKNRSKS